MLKNRFGLSVALATPFAEDRSIDLPRLVARTTPAGTPRRKMLRVRPSISEAQRTAPSSFT